MRDSIAGLWNKTSAIIEEMRSNVGRQIDLRLEPAIQEFENKIEIKLGDQASSFEDKINDANN